MEPVMQKGELLLYQSFLRCSDNYFEFGSGGSTVMAAGLVRNSITAIDSSKKWLDDVMKACIEAGHNSDRITLKYIDIGSIGNWGYPNEPAAKPRWPDYHSRAWEISTSARADLFMIDGRFRVACFLQTILHAQNDIIVLFHDYRIRPDYHVVEEVAREIASCLSLSAFRPIAGIARSQIQKLLEKYEFDPR